MSYMCYGDGVIVAGEDKPYYSTDNGKTWTSAQGSSMNLIAADYTGTDTFVGMSTGGGIYRSTDKGKNWSKLTTIPLGLTLPEDDYRVLWNLSYGNGILVASGDYRRLSDYYLISAVYTSSDNGSTWTRQWQDLTTQQYNGNFSMGWARTTFANGIFFLRGAGWNGENDSLGVSSDGKTWTRVSIDECYDSITYGDGVFLSVDTGRIWTSNNGTTWTEKPSFSSSKVSRVIYGEPGQ